jgi:hypothetical protein
MRCRSRWHFLILLACGLAASLAGPLPAAERIKSFQSDLVVAEDGLLTITETITVKAEGDEIKRGIYRDIPTRYGKGFLGLKATIPFEILAVEHNGQPSPYHTDDRDDFVRLYIGEQGKTIPTGKHHYLIRYATRQLRYFTDHDEVYWNATGNAWRFPIDRAEATVTLPGSVPLDQIDPEGYVGKLGSKAQQDLTAEVDLQRRQVVYATTRKLKSGEGLTIVARFPKGFVREPSASERLWGDPYFRWGSLGLVAVVGYFLTAWLLVGRDPATGVIYPRFEPPEGLSPAACRFISRMGFDKECFSVSLLSLATQGAVAINEDDGDYSLEKTGDPAANASPGERKVFERLLGDRTKLDVDREHHQRFSAAIEKLQKSLVGEFEGVLFRPNRLWFFSGVLVAIAALLATVFVAGGVSATGKAGFFTLWLSIWSVGCVALGHMVISAWRTVLAGGTGLNRITGLGGAIFITLFAAPFFTAEIVVLGLLATMTSLWLIPVLLGIVTTVAVCYELIKAPTGAGRAIMDQIDGFRMYLATAERDRLDDLTRQTLAPAMGSPQPHTLELFERFLPYAVALGVANQWAEQFQDLIEAASTEPQSGQSTGYHPAWYHGNAWSAASIGAAAAGLGTAMTAAVVAAATSPSSSSGGGGGGSSGGGGGGGGGGGW